MCINMCRHMCIHTFRHMCTTVYHQRVVNKFDKFLPGTAGSQHEMCVPVVTSMCPQLFVIHQVCLTWRVAEIATQINWSKWSHPIAHFVLANPTRLQYGTFCSDSMPVVMTYYRNLNKCDWTKVGAQHWTVASGERVSVYSIVCVRLQSYNV